LAQVEVEDRRKADATMERPQQLPNRGLWALEVEEKTQNATAGRQQLESNLKLVLTGLK